MRSWKISFLIPALCGLGACSATPHAAWPQQGSAPKRAELRRSVGLRQWVFTSFDYEGKITEGEVDEERDHAIEVKTTGLDVEVPLTSTTSGYVAAEEIDLDIGDTWRATVGARYYLEPFRRGEPFVFLELSHLDELEVDDAAEPDRDAMTFIGFGVGLVYALGEHYGLEIQLKHEDVLGKAETRAGPFEASEEFNGMLGLVALRWYF
ncbi:MAG: hypothetical protein QF903_14870 [Planctomycetota bacterium]|nr:hypothetical protein [Planctomycetota bacterium]MDP6762484.1 hypothetical protein [Planctomycetota bacterium]MDP6990752.1 hypothetical protein [Planctomycetota bacterium]